MCPVRFVTYVSGRSVQGVTGRDTGNSNPQSNPQLIDCCIHPHGGEKFALRGPRLVAVFLRADEVAGPGEDVGCYPVNKLTDLVS